MILDHIHNSSRHTAAHPGFAESFAFLRGLDLTRLSAGRIEISGDRLYALVVDADGKGRAGANLETHGRYIDIQYQAAGTDCIGWSSAVKLNGKGYDAAKDIEFYAATAESWITVPAGCFAIFFPEDAHAPMGGEGRQVKVVVKVRV
jgi:biofilm protein TabA